MNVAALIGIMIAIVVGVNMIKPITDATNTITTANGYSESVSNLAGVLVIVFVTVIIIGAVSWMAYSDNDTAVEVRDNVRKAVKNSKDFVLKIELESKKHKNYINNIGVALGVRTIELDGDSEALLITNGVLQMSNAYDWYITNKNIEYPNNLSFEVTGLHKKDKERNVRFLIGKANDKVYFISTSAPKA